MAGDGVEGSASRAPMWARSHIVFLLIAYVFSWTLWIAGWVVADLTDAGDLLFNHLSIVIHAAFNTLPLTLVLLWEGSPAAVLSNLLLWAVVIYLQTRSQRAVRAKAA